MKLNYDYIAISANAYNKIKIYDWVNKKVFIELQMNNAYNNDDLIIINNHIIGGSKISIWKWL